MAKHFGRCVRAKYYRCVRFDGGTRAGHKFFCAIDSFVAKRVDLPARCTGRQHNVSVHYLRVPWMPSIMLGEA